MGGVKLMITTPYSASVFDCAINHWPIPSKESSDKESSDKESSDPSFKYVTYQAFGFYVADIYSTAHCLGQHGTDYHKDKIFLFGNGKIGQVNVLNLPHVEI